ncbi:hypothetical protein ACJJTC_019569 [Scirpophaga incertulas]
MITQPLLKDKNLRRQRMQTLKRLSNRKKTKSISNKPQNVPKKKKVKQCTPSSSQWELWKQKDEELVDGNYENELQQAILLSKLDYEEKKDVYKQIKKSSDSEKKAVINGDSTRTGNKKHKKKNVMSLEQFNDMVNPEESSKLHFEEDDSDALEDDTKFEKDTEFFERIKDDTKNVILKDKIRDRIQRQRFMSDDVITRAQFLDELERKDSEIANLQQEIINLKKELLTVKSRNKKLCNILGQGEMKDKAEILVEVERLRSVQTELTAEIAALLTDLEKERSKNTQDPRTKDKKNKKKNIRFDASSEASKESSTSTG